jgi:Ca-activated chloride channel family protein
VDGGEVGPGHSVTAFYTVRCARARRDRSRTPRSARRNPDDREADERGASVAVADLGDGFSEAGPGLRVDHAAAQFAESLRHSPYGDEVNLPDLAAMALSAAERTGDRAVAELATLIRGANG